MSHWPDAPTVDWDALDALINRHGFTVERPKFSAHPHFPEVVYPIDYGYINDVPGEDGELLDAFFGTADTGLVAVARTRDHRKGDTELKLLLNCTPAEVYLVLGFLTFVPDQMTATLAMRQPMADLWART